MRWFRIRAEIQNTVEKVKSYADELIEGDYTIQIEIWNDGDFQVEAHRLYRGEKGKAVELVHTTQDDRIVYIDGWVDLWTHRQVDFDEEKTLEDLKEKNTGEGDAEK